MYGDQIAFCENVRTSADLTKQRFKNCMHWRSEFGGGLDKLVPTFEYTEKAQVFEYYPQYYHKTDKVTFIALAP